MPDTELTVVRDRAVPDADRQVVLAARRVPFVGGSEGWTAAPAWLQGMRDFDPGPIDVVASLELLSFASWQASGLARRVGALHVVLIFETLPHNPLYRLPPWRQITRRIVGTADAFVCFTELARRHAIELGCPSERCFVVHPGVDTQTFRPREERLTSEAVVLFVGMLRADHGADKGVMEIVEACERLAAEIEGLRLVLVGDGHLRPELMEQAAGRPFLEVAGRRPRAEIPSLMRNARVLTLASRRTWKWEEQFGFVLVEAMASGLPVVATRSGAIPEIVPTWNPLVAEGDVTGLEEGLRHALGPRGDEWGRRNRAHVLEHFDLRRQGRLLYETLSQVSARGKSK
ncbi:MAG: glycosyltransferase family 4 protein [Actinomycetota bacterium]|nr:glycosyltransferase family 4 protein [Actinomycetota bacterium]